MKDEVIKLDKCTVKIRGSEGGVEMARKQGHLLANRREFLIGVLAAAQTAAANGAGLDMPTGSSPLESEGAVKPDGAGRFEFGKDGTFTFLMITDWHRRTKRSDTAREIALFCKAVARFSPSLVVFGGDNISAAHMNCTARWIWSLTIAKRPTIRSRP